MFLQPGCLMSLPLKRKKRATKMLWQWSSRMEMRQQHTRQRHRQQMVAADRARLASPAIAGRPRRTRPLQGTRPARRRPRRRRCTARPTPARTRCGAPAAAAAAGRCSDPLTAAEPPCRLMYHTQFSSPQPSCPMSQPCSLYQPCAHESCVPSSHSCPLSSPALPHPIHAKLAT